ncbi:MAG: DUF5686 family protein [Ignavibacteriales bacterium]
MKIILILLASISLFNSAAAQQFEIQGRVSNSISGQNLSFANLRVLSSTNGTSANSEGRYQLKLPGGRYDIVASYIGFMSDTVHLIVDGNSKNVDFSLVPISIHLPGVTILPGKNPALEVIRKTIIARQDRAARINDYKFEAYTKGVIRSDREMTAATGSVTITSEKLSDSSKLKINGILENQSRGFFKKPDRYKEQIIARKQSANFPSSINLLTGGRLIQNFYNDDIKFFDRPLPGPISKDALSYYYYYIDDTLAIDNLKVFKIYFEPDKSSDPGFKGYVYISDSTFNLIKVDVELNRAANIGGLLEKVSIFQQFVPFENNIYMPIDYRLFIRANVLGLARLGFELNTIMYDYKINRNIDDDFFDKAILTVLKGADSKDSTYWMNSQTIPNTYEELTAYRKIDSIKALKRGVWDNPWSNLTSSRMKLSDNVSVSGPLGIYHYNRVEGHAADLNTYLRDLNESRLNADLGLSYGFSDKRMKQQLSVSYLMGDYRSYRLDLKAFNRLSNIFAESDSYNELTSTILALFTKYEFRDYFYSKGFNVNFGFPVFPVMNMEVGFENRTDNSARKNSDYSFFARNKTFSENPSIYDGRVNALSLGVDFDFRDYIEDGLFRRRTTQGNSYALFGGELLLSSKGLLGSGTGFTTYSAYTMGRLNTFRYASLNFRLYGQYSSGAIPLQRLYALPGNINSASKNYTFRTVRIGEVFGDRVVTLNLEHNFRDELFRLSGIPVLKDLELQLNTFFSAAWTKLSDGAAGILPLDFRQKPPSSLYEAGFSIGHVLFPISIEFGWRLNHRETNGFVVGLNAFVL